jgi:uncharacterized protein (TIGR00269 family)
MKCRRCGEKAVIKLYEHRLALCKGDFLNWMCEQTERFIKKYRMFTHEDRILAAVSGGKDSLSLWDILCKLGYQVDGLYIGLGIDGGVNYSRQSQEYARRFAEQRRLTLHIVDIPELYGETIEMMTARTRRGKDKPCSVCGIVKRHVMNRVAREKGYTVLATGHNLDDEAAVLFGNTINWLGDFLGRQSPVLEAEPGFARKVKPFCRFYERETAAYALLSGIDYVYDECPFSVGSKSLYYKDILSRLEEDRPGTKLTFYLSYLKAREQGLFNMQSSVQPDFLQPCPVCGQPTSTNGVCTFCRLTAGDDLSCGDDSGR